MSHTGLPALVVRPGLNATFAPHGYAVCEATWANCWTCSRSSSTRARRSWVPASSSAGTAPPRGRGRSAAEGTAGGGLRNGEPYWSRPIRRRGRRSRCSGDKPQPLAIDDRVQRRCPVRDPCREAELMLPRVGFLVAAVKVRDARAFLFLALLWFRCAELSPPRRWRRSAAGRYRVRAPVGAASVPPRSGGKAHPLVRAADAGTSRRATRPCRGRARSAGPVPAWAGLERVVAELANEPGEGVPLDLAHPAPRGEQQPQRRRARLSELVEVLLVEAQRACPADEHARFRVSAQPLALGPHAHAPPLPLSHAERRMLPAPCSRQSLEHQAAAGEREVVPARLGERPLGFACVCAGGCGEAFE